jgi:hypothetical protein
MANKLVLCNAWSISSLRRKLKMADCRNCRVQQSITALVDLSSSFRANSAKWANVGPKPSKVNNLGIWQI